MKIEEMMQQGRDALTVKKVFGEPYEKNGITVIPAAVVRGGGGGGSGEDTSGNQGGGGGFGMWARPIGVYQVTDSGVTWVPAIDQTRVIVLGQVAGIILLLMLRTVVRRLAKRR